MEHALNTVLKDIGIFKLQEYELEIRGVINEEQACKLVSAFDGGDVSQTVNIRKKDDILTKNLDTNAIIKHGKRRVRSQWVRDSKYKVVLSEEYDREHVDVNKPDVVRFKTRYSVVLDVKGGSVSLDITLVRNSNMRDLAATKSLFYKKGLKFSDAPYSVANTIELELEFISGKDPISAMLEAYKSVSNHISEIDVDYATYISKVAKMLGMHGSNLTIKQVASKVVGLTKNMLPIETHKYYITDKADGERALFLISDEKAILLSSTTTVKDAVDKGNYLADAELVGDKLYIFDVLIYENSAVYKQPLSERLTFIPKMVALCGKYFKVEIKPMYEIPQGQEREVLSTFMKKKRPYRTDGYILTPIDGYFSRTRQLKIKFSRDLSIDFLAKSIPERQRGLSPYKEMKDPYVLFCGINIQRFNNYGLRKIQFYNDILPSNHKEYFPIQFVASINTTSYLWDSGSKKSGEYDGKIVELSCVQNKDLKCEWNLLRIREDRQSDVQSGKYFGNDFDVAERTFMSMRNPVSLADLYEGDNRYFQRTNVDAYRAIRNFNSMVKTQLMRETSGPKGSNAIDLGSGNGQDMFRYPSVGVKKVLFVDNDTTALEELVKRKGSLKARLDIGVVQANIRDHKATAKAIVEANHVVKTKQLVCNMAVHYLTRSMDEYRGFAWLCNELLDKGGKLLLTFLDANSVDKKGDYEYEENNRIKYKIKRNYKTLGVGSEISLVLPFTNGELYTETLVNISVLEKELAKYRIKRVHSALFTEYENNSNKLHGADREFVGLYRAMIFAK